MGYSTFTTRAEALQDCSQKVLKLAEEYEKFSSTHWSREPMKQYVIEQINSYLIITKKILDEMINQ